MELLGTSIIGFGRGGTVGQILHGLNPATGERLMPAYYSTSRDEVNRAAELADAACAVYGRCSGGEKGRFLRLIAAKIELAGPDAAAWHAYVVERLAFENLFRAAFD